MKPEECRVSNLLRLQDQLRTMSWDGFIVPSTDEYLSEFSQPYGQRLRWLTNFSGSTGVAIVLQNRAALFLDGRYKEQGERETAGSGIEVLDGEGGRESWGSWLACHLRTGARLGIDTRLQSYTDVKRILEFAAQRGIASVETFANPVDALWGAERPAPRRSEVLDYPTYYSGVSAAEKCAQLREWLSRSGLDWYLLTDPEDVAWLLNVRTDDSRTVTAQGWHVVPVPMTRALVGATGKALWFVDYARLKPALIDRLRDAVEIADPADFERCLAERAAASRVVANLRKTPHRFAAIASHAGTLEDSGLVSQWRWRKHAIEIQRAREGHHKDGLAVIRFLAWLHDVISWRRVTELDAAEKLAELRSTCSDYKGISMPMMSASGPNGSMAHYVPSERTNRALNDHPIYWIDSGGQYYGCSTDNTVCFAVGVPELRHIRAHTLVVKGFIALSLARFPLETYSNQLDCLARQHLWQEGMDYYVRGTGHGVGNFMNIHEGPYIMNRFDHPLVSKIIPGMIITNEPGYYSKNDFGIRIESHMVVVESKFDGFLEFETISRLPIDPTLLDPSLLTSLEKLWLRDYHTAIAKDYEGCLDESTTVWLQETVDRFVSIAMALPPSDRTCCGPMTTADELMR